ncbi:MAG: molybdopterin-dependent oxidoreductase [Desulfobacca sp.]|uniref:molybdopterin-dependent oxidoreductase n=1 Tax=Desulfobacca sp. TaxID=2067990 RepID=UPI00404A7B49
MAQEVYSICFMCTVRCPIRVLVENDDVTWIEGNPHVPGIDGAMCAKGSAGLALLHDTERPQYPMIRTGDRGAGQWRRASWDEALDYAAEKLKTIVAQYGPQSVLFGERTNLNTHISKTFMKALGSPNHFTHDALCKGSINTACRSLTGYTDPQIGIDYGNTKHIVLYGRNIFEALEIKGVNNLMKARAKGAKITYIDPRFTVTASKANRYWQIRPGTDLALNYALMHVILREELFDMAFAVRWINNHRQELAALKEFVENYTPEWAEKETGVPAQEIVALAREVSADKPAVIFHFGYRGAHHPNEIYLRRSILILNALMGSFEAPGGLFFKKGLKAAGRNDIAKYVDQEFPKITVPRFDGSGGSRFPIADASHGNPQMLAQAILHEDPYPIKALIANRFEPLQSIADSNATRRALEKLDLILTIDVNFSEIAWMSDVILPESTYLERGDSVQAVSGLKPQLYLRKPAVSPRYDTKPGWWIIKELAKRLDLGQYFPYETIEDIWNFQLAPVGVKISDFDQKGFVTLSAEPIWWYREKGIKFKTPSGKFEINSALMENAGFPSLLPYEPVPTPPPGQFRLLVGRMAAHTHVSTQNNLYLNEVCPENELWINTAQAQKLGITDGAYVEVKSAVGSGRIKAKVTDFIHPEAVFMLHGFGKTVPAQTRIYRRGADDSALQENISDPVGGSPAYDHTIVQVRPLA